MKNETIWTLEVIEELLSDRARGWTPRSTHAFARDLVLIVRAAPHKNAENFVSERLAELLADEDRACAGHVYNIRTGLSSMLPKETV